MIQNSIEALESRIAPASLGLGALDHKEKNGAVESSAENGAALPALSVNDVIIAEGNTGTIDLLFTVSLSVPSTDSVTVNYATADGTARSAGTAADYQVAAGTLTFAPGETSKTVTIQVNGDTFKETDETFSLNLSGASNASIADGTGAGTISDDGDATIALTIDDAKVVEGDDGTKTAIFHVELSGSSNENTTFRVITRAGTATTGEDFDALSMDFQIDAGATSKDAQITIRGDTDFEATEGFFVDVSNVSANAQLIDGEGLGTIYNDDFEMIGNRMVRYVDEDGDLATVKVSKGVLSIGGVLVFSAPNGIGGRTLQRIDFTGAPQLFNDSPGSPMDLSVTAEAQLGFAESGGTSDGRVDVGFIQAGIPRPELLQMFNNIDLRRISIEGDLGKIVAGDQRTDRAVQSLKILSQGARGTQTGAPDNACLFLAGVQQVEVQGDWNGLLRTIGGDTGDIGNLVIGGALRGGSGANSGQIFFTGTLSKASIGSIVGGSGGASGSIQGNFFTDSIGGLGARIEKLQVLGDVIGGSGPNSGQIVAPNIGSVVVGTASSPAGLLGGPGPQSGVIAAGAKLGKVTITGDVVGGSSLDSGQIFAGALLGTVQINGSLIGAGGENSGSVISDGAIKSVEILKNVEGAAGDRSGSVQTTGVGTLSQLRLGSATDLTAGNLLGGGGDNSGTLIVGGDLKEGFISGSVVGGSGNGSGGLDIANTIKKLQIAQNLIGGSSTVDPAGSPDLVDSGYITAGRVGTLLVDGNVQVGTNGGTDLAGSGAIRVAGDLASIVIGGDLVGNATQRVMIAAGGTGPEAKNKTIGKLTVSGDTTFADIMGGYVRDASGEDTLGALTNADAQMGIIEFIGSIASTNVVAGVAPGPDGRFGTGDDEVPSGDAVTNAPNIQSRIARLIVRGAIIPNQEIYGVVAQVIGTKDVTGDTHVLTSGNDEFEFNPTGSNFRLREVPLA